MRHAVAAIIAAGTIAAGTVALRAQITDATRDAADTARSAWRYRRPVVAPAPTPTSAATPADRDGRFVAIAIPPEVAEHSQPGLQDLRLVADDGREVPFVLDADVPRTREYRRDARLVEVQGERRRVSAWVVDFGEPATFDRLELDVDGREFSKRVEIETSADGVRWTREGEAWIFDRPWRGQQIHDTTIERTTSLVSRFVRLTVDDFRSRPVTVRGVTAILAAELGGRRWTRGAALVRLETPAGQPSRYRVDAPVGAPVERLTIAAGDAAFWRSVRVVESGRDGAATPVSNATAIYRLRVADAELDAERLDIDLSRPVAGPLVVEIDDHDSPPLTRPTVVLSGVERRVLVPPVSSALTLYYGNAATRRPVYDLEAMRTRLALAATYPQATLGAEAINPRYVALPPLAFLSARGAAAETSAWAVARTVRIDGGDDVYTLTLAPDDLAYLRADLGDIRLVDADGRQVPYVLEPAAAAARVPLVSAPATARGNAPRTSAWTLTVKTAGPETATRSALPLAQLDLVFADGFFTRPAVLTMPDARAPQGQRVVLQEVLRGTRREASTAAVPLSFDLGGLRAGTLGLEISDGDNASLTLQTAEAAVWVPRLTFKAGAGSYRLLFGNAAAAAPTYDLAALRQDVLAYSATPLPPAAIQPVAANADYARGAGDVAHDLARGPLVWIALGVSIAALIWLTRVILKPPAPPSPPPTRPQENA